MEIKLGVDKDTWGFMFGFYIPERTVGLHVLCFYCNIKF